MNAENEYRKRKGTRKMKMKKLLNNMMKLMIGAALFLAAPAMESEAAEYSVTPAEAVLYTNDSTVILSETDDAAVVLPEVAADLPVQVTGITSNGYFQIALDGQTFYIHGLGLSAAKADRQVYDVIMAQKAVFPEGMHWTNDNYYAWKGGTQAALAVQDLRSRSAMRHLGIQRRRFTRITPISKWGIYCA